MRRRCAALAPRARVLERVLVASVLVALAAQCALAAPLPVHLRWLEGLAPPAVVGPALNMYFQSIPRELCAMGPDGVAKLPPVATNEICPLKAVSRLETIVPSLDHDAKIEEVAANPITFGGALMLLAANSVTQAADLQKSICKILLYPRKSCNFTSGDTVGPLFHRLTVDTTDAVGQWLLEQTVPSALGPLGASLTALPDMLCRMSPATLTKIPQEMKWDLCPYDVSALPVMTMFVMGRTGSGNLHAKLCDVLKRPQEACKDGRYHMDYETAEKIEEFTQKTNVLLDSLNPRLQLPDIVLPDIMSAASKGPIATLNDWWVNQTMPVLRHAVVTAIIPPNLQPPAVALLERLPTSICGLSLTDIHNLPWMFKREVCPLGGILRPGQGESGLQSWAVTLAEVAMGAAARNNSSSSRTRVEAWVARMCSVIYAPEVSCGNSTSAGGLNATDLAVQRIADEYKPITVKLLGAALAAMSITTRKQLTEGLSKQVESVPGLVAMLPKEVKAAFLSTACYVATPMATLQVDPNAPLLEHVVAGKAYRNEALDLAGLLVGEDKATELKDKLCADAPKPTPLAASSASDTATTVGYVKEKLGKVARGGMVLLQGVAARFGKTLLPTQAQA